MLRYIDGDDLHLYPRLRDSMFRDRAEQFVARLGWELMVDEDGLERDQYDNLNPLYVIWERADGTHGGSVRLLPMTGRTMLCEHFTHVADVSNVCGPTVWECTRFCLAPGAEPRVVAALVAGIDRVMQGFGLTHMLAVFDAVRLRIFRRLGTSPEVLGSVGEGLDQISVGLWDYGAYNEADRERMLRRAGLPGVLAEAWFTSVFERTSRRIASAS